MPTGFEYHHDESGINYFKPFETQHGYSKRISANAIAKLSDEVLFWDPFKNGDEIKAALRAEFINMKHSHSEVDASVKPTRICK